MKRMTMKNKRAVVGLLFIAPFIIGLLIIFIPSLVKAILFSFSDIIIRGNGYVLENVGLKYYKDAFVDNAWFVQELVATIWQMIINVPLIIAFSCLMAGMINQNFKGRTFVRAVLFLPVIISAGVVLKVDTSGSVMGISQSGEIADAVASMDIANLFLKIGFPEQFVTEISEIIDRIYEVITQSGVQILVLLAALQTMSSSLYEASSMEGATPWENFWKITFPMLSPYMLTCAVYTIIDSLASYNSPIMRVITETAQGSNANMSYSIAMAFIFFGVSSAILAAFVVMISRVVFYYD